MASVSYESVSFVSSWFMSVAMDIVEMSDSSGLIHFVVSSFFYCRPSCSDAGIVLSVCENGD